MQHKLHWSSGSECGYLFPMDFYWLYNIPTWQLFALINGIVCCVSLIGCIVLRDQTDIMLGLGEESNEVVGHFLSFTGIFYGIIFGLVAVGAWDTYNNANERAEQEAATLGSFYRNITQLPEPHRSEVQLMARRYTWDVIHREWPNQQKGIAPSTGDRILTDLAAKLYAVPATTPNIQITLSQSVSQFSQLVEARRARIQSTNSALPGSLWWVIIIGTMINIGMTWILSIKNKRLDIAVNLLMSLLMGTVMAFVIAMDNPYRGELSVSAQPYELIYQRLMGGDLAPK
jgi:hypothetical protein